ncbi:MAG: hypothetical protein FWG99_01280 [Treponema sp.]|nr:hypothetical protein [Treponema sp.]
MNLTRSSIIILFALIMLSCGLEEYYYLEQVPEEYIEAEFVNKATVRLPSLTAHYATNYGIFYRIYISGHLTDSIQLSSADLGLINSTLAADYSAIYPSTDPTSTSINTAIGTLFRNRRYYELALDGTNIRNVLTRNGGTLIFEFSTVPGEVPTLSLNAGTPIPLFRSNGEGTFIPEPDRYFFNSPDLNDNAKTTETINADTNPNTGIQEGAFRYTYVSLYVVAMGMDDRNFSTIFSKPTHIGIFKLPDSF